MVVVPAVQWYLEAQEHQDKETQGEQHLLTPLLIHRLVAVAQVRLDKVGLARLLLVALAA